MNALVQDIIVALVPVVLLNTGLLIYFCGLTAATQSAHGVTLLDHGKRISRLETVHRLAPMEEE